MPKICIVGAGVVGLSVGLTLLESIPTTDLSVTVVSDRPFVDITSYGPVGIFRPNIPGDRNVTRRWVRNSFDRMAYLWKNENPKDTGVQMVSGHIVSNNLEWLQDQERFYGDLVMNFRWLTEVELNNFAVKHKYGVFFTTFTTEGQIYVPWLMERFLKLGGKYRERHVNNLTELSDEFGLVINCCGLAAKTLVNDDQMVAYRGALIQVKAPWIKHFLFAGVEDETYLLPGQETLFLGTLRQENNFNLKLLDEERTDILRRCSTICPSLKGVPIVKEWVGLRPYRRNNIRLELEELVVPLKNKSLPVIHNYGHGGNGFTSSYGCALDVVSLAAQRLSLPRQKL